MEISNTDSYIDSRDIIQRIEELEDEIEFLVEERGYEDFDVEMGDIPESDDEYWELKEELDILLDVQDQCNYGDWSYGETLIHKDAFIEYCEELCTDLGYISRDFPWWIEIDWGKTADNIKVDYTEVDFDGQTYYMRS